MGERDRAGRIAADQAGGQDQVQRRIPRPVRAGHHGGQVAGADIGPPHRHRGHHVAGRAAQLPEMGADHRLEAGATQVKLEPGLDQIRVGRRQGARAGVSAQQLGGEQRVARGEAQDAAQQRAGPPARPVIHQALDHHRAHRRQPQPDLNLPEKGGQRLTRRVRPGRDQHGQRQALAGPDEPAQQRQGRRVEVVRILGAQHDRPVGAQLVNPVEGRRTRIGARTDAAQQRPAAANGSLRRPRSPVSSTTWPGPGGMAARIVRARKVFPMPAAPSMATLTPAGVRCPTTLRMRSCARCSAATRSRGCDGSLVASATGSA